ANMAAPPWCWARCRRARATPKWRCSRTATWIILLLQMQLEWASISTSITSRSPPTANMTAISSAGSIRPNSRRSQGDPAARDAEVRDTAHGAAAVERLWDACAIPDYRKIAPAAHAELVTTIYGFLMQKGRIPDAWYATQVDQADRIDGDIDTLSGRIAQI